MLGKAALYTLRVARPIEPPEAGRGWRRFPPGTHWHDCSAAMGLQALSLLSGAVAGSFAIVTAE